MGRLIAWLSLSNLPDGYDRLSHRSLLLALVSTLLEKCGKSLTPKGRGKVRVESRLIVKLRDERLINFDYLANLKVKFAPHPAAP